MHAREGGKEQAVPCHGVRDPRRSEKRQVEKAERRDRDRRREEPVRSASEEAPDRVRRRRERRGEPVAAERPQVHDVHGDVNDDDDDGSRDERAGQRSPRIPRLLRDDVRALPAAIREEDRHQRRTEAEKTRLRKRWKRSPRAGSRCRRRFSRRSEKPAHDENAERKDLQDHEPVQNAASRLDAENVDSREQCDRGDGQHERRRAAASAAGEPEGVLRERDRHGGDAAALDEEKGRPSEEKSHERVPRLAQVDVLAARERNRRCELGEHESARERDRAADDPRRKHESSGGKPRGDDGGIDEDPRADDSAHDDHRGVKGPQLSTEGHRRENIVTIQNENARRLRSPSPP